MNFPLSNEIDRERLHAMKVLVVDDHPLFLSGIRGVLESLADDVSVLEAGSAEDAIEHIQRAPDIDFICLDLQLPGLNGIEFLAELRKRRVPAPVVILSALESPNVIHCALKAGANGYISKTTARDELVTELETIARSGHYVSPILRRRLDNFRAGFGTADEGGVNLTRRSDKFSICSRPVSVTPKLRVNSTLLRARSKVISRRSTRCSTRRPVPPVWPKRAVWVYWKTSSSVLSCNKLS